MTYPTFNSGDVLTAAEMNAVGLWLVKTQTVGSAVPSVTVSSAFTSDYANYIITWSGGTMSADSDIGIQLGASVTGYYQFLNYGASSTATPLAGARNNTSSWSWVGGGLAGQAGHARAELFNPNVASYTKLMPAPYQNASNYGTTVGEHRVATAYTAFNLFPGLGTITGGTIRIYGYRN
jgi:hypothetical protein